MHLSQLIELHTKRVNFTVCKVYLNFNLISFANLCLVVFIYPDDKLELLSQRTLALQILVVRQIALQNDCTKLHYYQQGMMR